MSIAGSALEQVKQFTGFGLTKGLNGIHHASGL